MPTQSEFEVALDDIAEYVWTLQHEVTKERAEELVWYEDHEEDMYAFTGHRCSYNDTTYLVAGHPKFEFMSVLCFSSIQGYLEAGITESIAEVILDNAEQEEFVEEDEEKSIKSRAATILFNRLDDRTVDVLEDYFHWSVSGEGYITEIQASNDNRISYITVEKKIFPYHEGFGIREVNDSITNILHPADKADTIIRRSITLNEPDGDNDNYSLSFNLSW